jgi:hypothetical protein
MAVNELVRFGPGGRLTGVLTDPAIDGPILLLPSAGLQPRAGPFRLHAELAERLRARGIRSFRYDVPGVGEAPRVTGCGAQQATLAAIDHLEARHGGRSFAVGGICSAADTGWDVANVDARVSAVLLLDGLCFTGPWYHYARTLDRLRRIPRHWRRMLHSVKRRVRGAGSSLDANAFRTWPSHATARSQFAQLVARDVRLLCIFSGGYAERFMHPRQFAWSFGAPARDPRVTMHFWPDCDHTYYGRAHRERLITTIEDWMAELAKDTRR